MSKRTGGGLAVSTTVLMFLLAIVALALVCVKTVPVKAQSSLSIDLYGGAVNAGHGNLVGVIEQTDLAFPAPYGGEGPNTPMDVVEPQSLVYLNAHVTASSSPVQNENVTFEIQEPNFTLYTKLEGLTDSEGVASVSIRMPWPSTNPESLLGTWTVTATVQVADQSAKDTMQFQYDYFVHVWNVTTDNPPPEPGPPPGYGHGDPVNIHVNYGSYFMQQLPISPSYPVLFLVQISDNLGVTIGTAAVTTIVGGATWNEYANWTISMCIRIPKSAYAGTATILVSVFDGKEPVDGGVAIAPNWIGPAIVILPISVPPKVSVTFYQMGVGPDFTGIVVVVDSVGYSRAQLPVSFIWTVGSTHSFAFQSPLFGGTRAYNWSSTTGLSTLQSASIITVTGGCGNITGIYITGLHGVIVTDITAPVWVYQDVRVRRDCANISVTVKNIGNFPEDAWVTLYYDITTNKIIGAFPVHLEIGQSYTHLFIWNTADVPCHTYTLTAVATIPTGSNTFSDGTITVRLIGDANGDGRVNLRDIALVVRAIGSTLGSPNWNAAADMNCDGKVDMLDLALAARHVGAQTTY